MMDGHNPTTGIVSEPFVNVLWPAVDNILLSGWEVVSRLHVYQDRIANVAFQSWRKWTNAKETYIDEDDDD